MRITLAALVLVATAFAQEPQPILPNAPSADERANALLVDTAKTALALREIPVRHEPGGFPETDVPAAARPLLTQLKHDLRDLMTEALNSPKAANPRAAQILSLDGLARVKVRVGEEDRDGYGAITGLQVDEPAGHPELVALTTTLRIPCGLDTSLYIYQRRDTRWELVLQQEANDYAEISGGQEQLAYAISPSDEFGRWYAVTAYHGPWCSSMWTGIDFRAMRPGAAPASPQVLIKREDGAYRGADQFVRLTAMPHWFRVSWYGSMGIDTDILIRPYIAQFRIDENDRVTRTAPIALHAEDFVDEWTDLQWSDVLPWTNPAARSKLRRWHEKVRQIRKEYEHNWTGIAFVQPCPKPLTWQVGLDIESENAGGKGKRERRLVFSIAQRKGAFIMESISEKRPPGCPGQAPKRETADEPLP